MSEVGLSATLVAAITDAASGLGRPLIVALDGRIGAGKSTLAALVAATNQSSEPGAQLNAYPRLGDDERTRSTSLARRGRG